MDHSVVVVVVVAAAAAAAAAVVKLGVAYCRGINAEGSQMTILICRQLALD